MSKVAFQFRKRRSLISVESVLYALRLLGALRVVEAAERAYKVACNTADTLKRNVAFFSAAHRALVIDYTRVSAYGVTVNGVID